MFTVLAPVATGYFAYRQARFEAAAATAHTQNEAEAGYKTTVNALERVTKLALELQVQIAELRGTVNALESRTVPFSPLSTPLPAPAAPAPRLKSPQELFGGALPRSLSEAAKQ